MRSLRKHGNIKNNNRAESKEKRIPLYEFA